MAKSPSERDFFGGLKPGFAGSSQSSLARSIQQCQGQLNCSSELDWENFRFFQTKCC